jgi:hypothetical protein
LKPLFLAAALALPLATLAAEPPTPLLILVIRPAPPSADAQINYVDVSETIPSPDARKGAPLLTLPLVFNNVESVARKLTNFSITDARGSVPVTTEDDPDNNPAGTRRWLTARPTHGTLQLHYRAPIDNAPQVRGSGPPFGLRTETGAFSGIGRAFIVLPTTSQPYKISLHWELAALAPHATAMSSF